MDGIARTRIGRVKIKGGAEVRLLHHAVSAERAEVESRVRSILDGFSGNALGGFAFVLWGTDGSTDSAAGSNPEGNIPTILIPDFVRNILLARRIETWTIETVNESWGFPPSQGA